MAQEETIPLTFDAVDNLSKAVLRMTALLERMEGAQEDTTKATEEATDATKKQADATDDAGTVMVKLNAAVELGKSAWEAFGGVYERIGELVTGSLEKWDEQSKKLGTSASALGSVAEAQAAYEKASDKALAALGRVIDRSSIYQAVTGASTAALGRFEAYLAKNGESLARWANGAAKWAAEAVASLGSWLERHSETLARFTLLVEGLGKSFVLGIRTIGLFAQALRVLLLEAISASAAALGGLTDGLATLIEGQFPDLAAELRHGANAFRMAEDAMAKMSDTAQTELMGSLEEVGTAGEDIQGIFAATFGDGDERLKAHANAWKAVGQEVNAYANDVTKALDKGVAGPGRARTDLAGPEKPIPQMPLPDYAKLFGEAAARRKELIEIEDTARQEQLEWDAYQDERARERYELAIERIEGRRSAEEESIGRIADALQEGFEGIPDALDVVTAATERMSAGLGRAAAEGGNLFKALNNIRAANAAGKKSQDDINAAIGSSVGAISAATSAFVANKKQQAAIDAALNAAAAVASLAAGDLAGAGLYALAAAQFGLIAGGAIGGAPAGAGAGGEASAGPAGERVDLERERQANANAIAEALAANEADRGARVINIDFGNALIASDSPQAVQSIVAMLEPELMRLIK